MKLIYSFLIAEHVGESIGIRSSIMHFKNTKALQSTSVSKHQILSKPIYSTEYRNVSLLVFDFDHVLYTNIIWFVCVCEILIDSKRTARERLQ